ncbi:MAG: M48 family metallopeptidase [Patescibacteria group bacterium]|nr:M48 family metallopeptidase [Patescibacteria group bacterium]
MISSRIRIRLRVPLWQTRSRKLYMANREAARSLVHERIGHFMAHYGPRHGIVPGRVAIRNQRSRWGSCSRKGNLNFNYKILFLPAAARDYVIVHELCHLKEFNHGRRFWDLVAETVPDYKAIKKGMRERVG